MANKHKPVVLRNNGGPWFGDERARLTFEGSVKKAYPLIGEGRPGFRLNKEYQYKLPLGIDPFQQRVVTITFPKTSYPKSPKVIVDGPVDSPHRYSEGHLCLWYPGDEKTARWTHSDGLVVLIDLIRLHLIREAWWRESGEWAGPEILHAIDLIKNRET